MTDKKNDGHNQAGGKKPSAIIDLKATVVEPAKSDQPRAPSVETRAAFANNTAKPVTPPPSASVPNAQSAASKSAAPAAASAAPAATSPAMPPTPPKGSRGGFMSHLLSGVAGGVLALLGASALPSMLGVDLGLLAPASDTKERMAALEQKLAKAMEPAQKLAAADTRLAKLEEAAQALASGQVKIAAETRSLGDKLAKAGSLPQGAGEKLAKLEEQLAQMTAVANANPQGAGRLPQLAQLTGKLGEVETALATRTAQLKAELMQQMDQRFTKSGETLETTRSTIGQRTQSVEQSVKILADETASLRSGVDAVKIDLDKRFRETAKPADVQAAVAPVVSKLASLEANMQGVVKSEQDRNATAGNILLSLELANLKRALDRGGKYASELAAVRGLAGPKLDLSVLEARQTTGVPSLAELGHELAGIAHSMLDAEAEPANATFAERLLSGAKSIVRVRKVDFAPDDQSTEALIARMEQALKQGRLADVLEDSKKLSPKAAAPATKWLDRIKGRAAIDAALASLDASLKTSLAGGAAPKKVSN